MISAYVVVALVFGMVLSYLWIIHHFACAMFSSEDHKPTADTKITGDVENFSESKLERPGKMRAAQIGFRTMKARTE